MKFNKRFLVRTLTDIHLIKKYDKTLKTHHIKTQRKIGFLIFNFFFFFLIASKYCSIDRAPLVKTMHM